MRYIKFFLVFLIVVCFMNCKTATDPTNDKSERQILDLTQYNNQYELTLVLDHEIFVINSDGSNIRRLTENAYYDHLPLWTPTGDALIFETFRNGSSRIYKMNPDGTEQVDISQGAGACHSHHVDPTGQRILFVELCSGGYSKHLNQNECPAIAHVNLDGADKTRITALQGGNNPKWSPDGQTILIDVGGKYIYTFDLDGNNIKQLTDSTDTCRRAEWHPEGNKIIYQLVTEDIGGHDIYIMDSNGENKINLTNSPEYNDISPRISPAGDKILYISNQDGDYDIFIMNADGTGHINLTNDPYEGGYSPSWSPDGTRIAYSLDTNGDEINDTIFIIDVETGYYQKLTEGWLCSDWKRIPIGKI